MRDEKLPELFHAACCVLLKCWNKIRGPRCPFLLLTAFSKHINQNGGFPRPPHTSIGATITTTTSLLLLLQPSFLLLFFFIFGSVHSRIVLPAVHAHLSTSRRLPICAPPHFSPSGSGRKFGYAEQEWTSLKLPRK